MSLSPLTDLRRPENLLDPYSYYARLRRDAPIVRDPSGPWVFSRYQDVLALLVHPNASVNRLEAARRLRPDGDNPEIAELFASLTTQLIFIDPPAHTRLRALVTKAFTPAVVREMSAKIQDVVDQLLRHALEREQFDVIADLAIPLPITIICDLLGIPSEDRMRMKAWCADIARFFSGFVTLPTQDMLVVARASRALRTFIEELATERLQRPGDDLLSRLLHVDDAGHRLSIDEAGAMVGLLVFAGHETTTNLIGNGLLALVQSDCMDWLRTHPAAWPTAVEELLRYDAPVQMFARVAVAEMKIGDCVVAPGELAYGLLGSANRDETKFNKPDRLDLTRAPAQHMAFGRGTHFCVGAALARLEGSLLLRALVERTQSIELLHAAPAWAGNAGLRGLTAFPVRARCAPPAPQRA